MLRTALALPLAVSLILLAHDRASGGPITLPDGQTLVKVDFECHVQALLNRVGCSAGQCHGHRNGRGGFSLSLMAGSAKRDHEQITRGSRGRRLSFADPDGSLLLLKATGRLGHEGGMPFSRVPGNTSSCGSGSPMERRTHRTAAKSWRCTLFPTTTSSPGRASACNSGSSSSSRTAPGKT